MKIAVLGAGVIGVTSAWYLARGGHEVVVVDRRDAPALETSFANGGQISASYAEPWANPSAPRKILGWLGREDAPLLFRLRADWRQWRWGLSFLLECLPSRTRRNTIECLKLALYSRDALDRLRAETSIEYDALTRGILQFYEDAGEYEEAIASAEVMRELGCDRDVRSVDACIALEPALAQCRQRIVGGIYTASDESGDARRFTAELARLAAAEGVRFRFGVAVQRLVAGGDAIASVVVRDTSAAHGSAGEALAADAYVLALGSYSPLLARGVGIDLPVYPVKGYSITLEVGSHRGAPTVSLTDISAKIVMTRLGARLRVAGTAELAGYDTSLNANRCDALVARTFDLLPDAGERDGIERWTGLRPATPSNVPLVGRTRYRNLWLNTGHGTLGWTMACGSARALADLVSGRAPEVDFAFTAR